MNLGSGAFPEIGADAFAGTLDIAVQIGAVAPPPVVGAVPEPDAPALIGLGLTELFALRRRGSRRGG